MNKRYLSIILCLAVILSMASVSFAAVNLAESSGTKIIIEGKQVKLAGSPLIADGKYLLVTTDFVNKLGVANDSKGMVWDKDRKGLTISKGTTKIYLKADSKKATVNKKSVTMSVAPVVYKSKLYIPAEFTAVNLGMKFSWDTKSKTVQISKAAVKNDVTDMQAKAANAMKSIERYKMTMDMAMAVEVEGEKITTNTKMNLACDMKNKIAVGSMEMAMPIAGLDNSMKYEYCLTEKAAYMKIPMMGWQKTDGAGFQSGDADLYNLSSYSSFDGLKLASGTNANEIVLKGNVNLNALLGEQLQGLGTEEYKLDNTYYEVALDKKTFLTKRVYIKTGGVIGSGDESTKFTLEIKVAFSDYNGNFKVTLPADLKQ